MASAFAPKTAFRPTAPGGSAEVAFPIANRAHDAIVIDRHALIPVLDNTVVHGLLRDSGPHVIPGIIAVLQEDAGQVIGMTRNEIMAARAGVSLDRLLHGLHGAAITIGAHRLSEITRRMKEAARTADEAMVRDLAAFLEWELENTCLALSAHQRPD